MKPNGITFRRFSASRMVTGVSSIKNVVFPSGRLCGFDSEFAQMRFCFQIMRRPEQEKIKIGKESGPVALYQTARQARICRFAW